MENNSIQNTELQSLIEKYVNKTYSKEEFQQIIRLAEQGSKELFNALRTEWDKKKNSVTPDEDHWNKLFNSMMERANQMDIISMEQSEDAKQNVRKIGGVRRSIMKSVAAAAAIIIAISTTIFFLVRTDDQQVVQRTQTTTPIQEITPGGNKATLTLADNSVIVLDNAQNGTITQQGNTSVTKLDNGQIAYNASGEAKEVLYNTISTPRGGQYQTTLSDGSKVWLNAASSIKFPVAFTGNERRVEITGEAYFEVAKNAAMPFKINVAGKEEVEVLGTHFNINSYTDESFIKTTLLEGSVKVSNNIQSVIIKPGEQTQVNSSGGINISKNVDVEGVIAWKNGLFYFEGLSFVEIMRQIERWYDIKVVYQDVPNIEFEGKITRGVTLNGLMNALRDMGVNYKLESRTLTIID